MLGKRDAAGRLPPAAFVVDPSRNPILAPTQRYQTTQHEQHQGCRLRHCDREVLQSAKIVQVDSAKRAREPAATVAAQIALRGSQAPQELVGEIVVIAIVDRSADLDDISVGRIAQVSQIDRELHAGGYGRRSSLVGSIRPADYAAGVIVVNREKQRL